MSAAKGAAKGAGTGAAAGAALGPWGAAIGGLAGGVVGLLGGLGSSAARRRAAREIEALKRRYQYLAENAPNLEVGDSAAAGAQADPRFIQAQIAGLDKLQQIVAQGGLTAEDRANLENIRQEQLQQEQGQRQAILQNAAARGLSNSNLNYASQLQASQNAANQAATQGREVASMAQKRALQAALQTGQLGTIARSQDFNEKFARGGAQDAVNRFNASMRNTAYQNQANAINDQYNMTKGKQAQSIAATDLSGQTAYDFTKGLSNTYNAAFSPQENKYSADDLIALLKR